MLVKDKLGRKIWCPYGVLGKCYIIDTPDREREIIRFNRRFSLLAVIVSVSVVVWYGTIPGLGVFALGVIMYIVRYRRWQSDMTVCAPDAIATDADILSSAEIRRVRVRLCWSLGICILVIVCAVCLLARGELFFSILGLVMAGSGVVVFVRRSWRLRGAPKIGS